MKGADPRYWAMVEAAAERTANTDIVDLVDLAEAATAGFDTTTFERDVRRTAALIDFITIGD